MKNYLLKMSVNGVKSIDQKVELVFYKAILSKNLIFDNCNVKAIYGANGAGKTALMYAAEIYKQFVLDKDYIVLNTRNSTLYNLINQKTKKMEIEMTFAVINDDNTLNCVYSHIVSFSLDGEKFSINSETLKRLHGYRLNDDNKFKTIYSVEKGSLVATDNDCLIDISRNVITDRSIVSNAIFQAGQGSDIKNQSIFLDILNVFHFAQNLTIVLNGSDKNSIDVHYIAKQIQQLSLYEKQYNPELLNSLLSKQRLTSSDKIVISKKYFDLFKSDMKNMCKFIQIFKSNLKNIDVSEEEYLDNFACNINFIYEDNSKIERKYESTGIKKLMSLYYAFCDIDAGKIVFIDEFDANMHDVVLMKLIEYVQNYTPGQLVFTTHNLGPMDILQRSKYSIDFLSNDSHLVSWTKLGNSPAASVYKRGLIKYSPFNIESFDFLGVFNNESNE